MLAIISDKALLKDDNSDGTLDYYTADVKSASDYYPFGMQMPGRSLNSSSYRYGFNGKENNNEVKGEGNSIDFGSRIYDPRSGRWLSVDPLMRKYPGESNYVYVGNNPIVYNDQDGKDKIWYVKVISKDGTELTVATEKIKNNEMRLHSEENFPGGPSYFSTDIKQTITYDLRNHKITVSGEESDYSSKHPLAEGIGAKIAKSLEWTGMGEGKGRGVQNGGWTFTSEDANTGDGPKTDAKKGSSGTVNIDLFMAAIGSFPGDEPRTINITDPADLPEAINTIHDFKEAVDDYKENNSTTSDKKNQKPAPIKLHFDGSSASNDKGSGQAEHTTPNKSDKPDTIYYPNPK